MPSSLKKKTFHAKVYDEFKKKYEEAVKDDDEDEDEDEDEDGNEDSIPIIVNE